VGYSGIAGGAVSVRGWGQLVLPLDQMAGPIQLPGAFLRFVGVSEVLGAVGLILPGLLRIKPGLTPVAASGLTIIMIGATVVTAMGGSLAPALVPVVVGLLTISVPTAGRAWRNRYI